MGFQFKPISTIDPDQAKRYLDSYFKKADIRMDAFRDNAEMYWNTAKSIGRDFKYNMQDDQIVRNIINGFHSLKKSVQSGVDQAAADQAAADQSSADQSSSTSSSVSPSSAFYPNAPYATMYGMSSDTAYQEALANTSHQREVADLRAAGLNPVLGVSGSGASVFSGSSSAGVASSASSSPLVDLIGDILTLSTGKSSIGNAAKSIGQSLNKILSD